MNTLTPTRHPLREDQIAQFERDGFLTVRDVYSPAEIAALRDHFMAMHSDALDKTSPLRERYQPLSVEESGGDKLKQFPRIMHPARFDEMSFHFMLDARVQDILRQLLGKEPLAAQSMLYFKPAGAKGQALHQDNFYLHVSPGTCMAAWMALDDIDEENGGMFVVPGSHKLPVLCPHMADMEKSFTTEEVTIPDDMETVPAIMGAGDILFFNGQTIHGSYPNTSEDRFRRSFICHYVGDSTLAMNGGYYPLWTFAGEKLERDRATGGSHTCGNEEWAEYQAARERFLGDYAAHNGMGMAH